ncbi:MAG: hypothetical protein HY985_05380 [Magnetospirillum sp.]|nr:hypothetical protein [Magnetospirillum sp.]
MGDAAHLWVALSPHGYGHAAMTAPVVAELRRRRPGLRLTVQTALPHDFLVTRYGDDFTLVPEIPDFGMRMLSSTEADLDASAAAYAGLHADWPAAIAAETERLGTARPDLVLANVPYVTIAAAAAAGVPVVALSSLNWADIYRHYLGHRPEGERIYRQMLAAYRQAMVFLRCEPAMPMTVDNQFDVGPIARGGRDRRGEILARLGKGQGVRLGLISFGGIDHHLAMAQWPRLEGWQWLSTVPSPSRADVLPWQQADVPFSDLLASADVVVTKPGYGTFTEAALAGVPVLYLARPDWPESPNLDHWLARHTRCRTVDGAVLLGPGLAEALAALEVAPIPSRARASGIDAAVDILERILDGQSLSGCERSCGPGDS